MEERKIYLVRHGQIEIPVNKKIYLGQLDVDLNEKGIEQAQQLGLKMSNVSFEKIYCSSLKRTMKTAEIIGKHHDILPNTIDEFREIHLGEWEGLSFDEVKKKYPKEFEKRGKEIFHYCVLGGESFSDCNKRVMKKFYEILAETTGNLLIVAHAGVNRLILCNILEKPLENFFQIPQGYGCFNVIIQNCEKYEVTDINRSQ